MRAIVAFAQLGRAQIDVGRVAVRRLLAMSSTRLAPLVRLDPQALLHVTGYPSLSNNVDLRGVEGGLPSVPSVAWKQAHEHRNEDDGPELYGLEQDECGGAEGVAPGRRTVDSDPNEERQIRQRLRVGGVNEAKRQNKRPRLRRAHYSQ